MSRLPHPSADRPFDRVLTDLDGAPEWGIRDEHTPDEEIVHLPTQRSNQAYHRPERVLDPSGCEHTFLITSLGRREIECERCHLATTFHPAINYHEEAGQVTVTLRGKRYPLRS